MVTRVGGLASGMDIDSIVEKLMSAEKAPLNKLYQQQQKYEWQRDAYREVNTSLSTFDSYLFDNFRLSSNFYKKTVSSSNSSLVTATANSSSAGTLSIDGVSQLATSARGVGNTINATGSTKLSSSNLGITDSSVKLNAIQANGKMLDNAVEITIDTDETVDSFIKKINSSGVGVTALFENGKLSITAKNMGNNANGGEVTVESGASTFTKLGFASAGTTGVLAEGGTNAIFSINGIATERSSNTFTLNGYTVTLNSTFNSGSTITNYKDNATTNYTNVVTNLTGKYNIISGDDNTTIINKLDTAISSAESVKASATNDLNTAKSALTTDELTTYNSLSSSTKDLLKTIDWTELDYVNDLTYTQITDKNFVWTSSTLSADEITKVQGLTEDQFNKIKALTQTQFDNFNDVTTKNTALTAAQTSLNTVNNDKVTYQNAYNTKVAADSMTVPTGTTVAPVTLTSSTDTDNMVTKIKEFVDTYNGLIANINSKLKESYDRNYQPLTEEQKKDMEADQITSWETKAKKGLLRNDSILTNGLYDLRRTFSSNIAGLGDSTIDSLAEIGITTSSVTSDRGKLVINEDKLRAAIEKNPDQVASIFTKTGEVTTKTVNGKKVTEDSRGIAQRLRDELKDFTTNIEKKAGKTTSTNQTFTIGKRLAEIEDKISSWEDRLGDIESRYWKQFTAMETAINKANSQSSIFASA